MGPYRADPLLTAETNWSNCRMYNVFSNHVDFGSLLFMTWLEFVGFYGHLFMFLRMFMQN